MLLQAPDHVSIGARPHSWGQDWIATPRLADAAFSMECKTWQVINVKDDRQLVIGEGLRFHIRDELWDAKAMRVHMEKYHPVGRMFTVPPASGCRVPASPPLHRNGPRARSASASGSA